MLSEQAEAPRARERSLVVKLRSVVGGRHVLTGAAATRRFSQGYRFGGGPVLAVVRPGTLSEQWEVLQHCTAAGVIIIVQAANTGLTGGSTPFGHYDRDVIIINTGRLRGTHLLRGGEQVLCLPGTTLHELEQTLKPLGREPHSVIGSSCLGATVIGGICNNSGGALVRRGPAYTELALYAQVGADGALRLINHLGMELGTQPEEILARLDRGCFTDANVTTAEGRAASDARYRDHVRQIDEDTPARFNADPLRLFEAAGSAGKVVLFAVRLDTFPADERTATFYLGTNDPAALTRLRRHILSSFSHLPVSGEYVHRDAFDIAARYGKDLFLAIKYLGTEKLPALFATKARLDNWADRLPFLPRQSSDHFLQWCSSLWGDHLPRRLLQFRQQYEHHLILKMADGGVEEARDYLGSAFASSASDFFECSPSEAADAFRHRFAVAGAAVRYRAMHQDCVEEIVAIDFALRRNDQDWVEQLPASMSSAILHRLYYGHFFCHVFHHDYVISRGADAAAVEEKMLALLDQRGAEYPAEHNVGHLYHAKQPLAEHYARLDPLNIFNPGIGRTGRAAKTATFTPRER
ncbi:D-lactate dehydrogenase [Flavisphingomonas formosensis]|uniref:D-lactate dehydrogenase n=1 Tax=Flavisphingomonas formosensis TaxID=861534 RepID=UPI001E641669|nr:D-lactate dehydrogenase [Sphingomonas formosensis]